MTVIEALNQFVKRLNLLIILGTPSEQCYKVYDGII